MLDSSLTPLVRLHDISFSVSERGSQHRKFGTSWLAGAKSNNLLHSKSSAALSSSPLSKSPLSSSSREEKRDKKQLLKRINMTILPHEKMSVIGPNGAGKSTLMQLILGLISPTSGHIERDPNLAIGYVPQKFTVQPILPLRVADLLAQVDGRLSVEQQQLLYEHLSIMPLIKQQIAHLSGGETQRVLLARALLSQPNLLVLDEPMQGLDPESERWLYGFIDDLPSFLQCAMVVVSHDLHWVMKGSHHVICLNKHICCEGQPSDLGMTKEFKNLFGRQYEQPYIHQPHVCSHADTQSNTQPFAQLDAQLDAHSVINPIKRLDS